MRRLSVIVALLGAALLAAPASATNDPLYPRQWGLQHVRAPGAWTTTTGGGTVVAVVDTGVDLGHPDLAGKVIAGSDLANGDANPQDDHDHGTHVAGIAAAISGNGRGVAGVAPAAQILAIKVLDEEGSGSSSDVASGIRQAADRGSTVINLSLSELLPLAITRSVQVDQAIRYATSKGSVVIAAAGNDAFPFADRATADIALLVGATAKSDTRASYSNSGAGVRIWAPGGDIAQGLFCSDDSGIWSTVRRGAGGCGQAHYHQFDGTSMAAPHVAGAAALVRSINPSLSPAQVIDILIGSADRTVDALPRLNAERAVAAAPRPGGGAGPPGGGSSGPPGGGSTGSGSAPGTGGATGRPQAEDGAPAGAAASPGPGGSPSPGVRESAAGEPAEEDEGGNVALNIAIALALVFAIGGGYAWVKFRASRRPV